MRRLHFKRNPVRNSHNDAKSLRDLGKDVEYWIDDTRKFVMTALRSEIDDYDERRALRLLDEMESRWDEVMAILKDIQR